MLLISDANVLFDLETGGLLEAIFALPETFAVPDIFSTKNSRRSMTGFEAWGCAYIH